MADHLPFLQRENKFRQLADRTDKEQLAQEVVTAWVLIGIAWIPIIIALCCLLYYSCCNKIYERFIKTDIKKVSDHTELAEETHIVKAST